MVAINQHEQTGQSWGWLPLRCKRTTSSAVQCPLKRSRFVESPTNRFRKSGMPRPLAAARRDPAVSSGNMQSSMECNHLVESPLGLTWNGSAQ